MSTYGFTAFLEESLLQGQNGSSIGYGDTFTMPVNADAEFVVIDDDQTLSGDRYANEVGDDNTLQTADITINGEQVFDDVKIYAEQYHVLYGSDGNYYYLIEIELSGASAPGQGDDFFTFYGNVPPAGVTLTVYNAYNVTCDWVDYNCLDAGPVLLPVSENTAPVAEDDAYITDEASSVSGNVLDNDSDPDGDAITVTSVDGGDVGVGFEVETAKGNKGTVTLEADGSFTFTPGETFKSLAQNEQDSFELTYTITDDPTAAVKHNLLFVIDISNSTVQTSGQNSFDGVGNGDQNGDGVSDTVLDAQIAGILAAVQSLIDQGVDPSNIDIGLVTFSGVASGYANVDAATLGTFGLGDSALTTVLQSIQSGGWTNYEAGLQQAEAWLEGQQGDGAQNKVVFLSDGRPYTGYANGGYIAQSTADYGDEVSAIANTYGADIYAIGVGANSDLDYLNDLDNTGGAERVLDTNQLNVALENAVAVPASASATITVTINGLNEGPDAANDSATIFEDESASFNILLNDSDPEDDPISIVNVGGQATGTDIFVQTTGGRMGIVSVDAAGNLSFTPGPEFTAMNDTDSDSFQLTYTITDGQFEDTATITVTINGKGEPVDAVDDAYTVGETEDVASNILDNDTPNDGSLSIVALSEDGIDRAVGESFEVTTDGNRTGMVKVNEDGSFTFDGADNFLELQAGETDTFDLQYTVQGAASAGAVPQHNILFVIDISGSTSPATFGGSVVGDQNGDGVENSVLDAEIAAYKALAAQIVASGIDENKVDIGLVVFSGNSGWNQTGASELLGTFKPSDSGLSDALANLRDGGWTNFEAPLQVGINWFENQGATTDDKNIVYFLSDGMQNRGGSFEDESAELANRFGAELNAVGVGTDAVLEQLNVIDNTGGAEIVTTTDALTAALVDAAPEVPGATDMATVTVTIVGEGTPLAAADDFITVLESETSGDVEDIFDLADHSDSAASNILANDDDNGMAPAEVAKIIVNGVEGSFGQSIQLVVGGENKGRVTIHEDGTVDFDADGDFDALEDNQSEQVTFDYTIERAGPETTATRVVSFNDLSAGDIVSGQIEGLTISALRDGQSTGNSAMIFDSANPTGGDGDLATASNGNLLIISEDVDSSDPDDNAGGGAISITFDEARGVQTMTFVDTEEGGAVIDLSYADGSTESLTGPQTLNGHIGTFNVDRADVMSMTITLQGSGAVDDIVLVETVAGTPEVADATVTVTVEGVTDDGPPDIEDPDPVYTLRGDIETDGPAPTQSITFIIDHSFEMFRRIATETTEDVSGDGTFNRVIDAVLLQISEKVATLDPGDKVNFILAGENGVVGSKELNAQAVQSTLAAGTVSSLFKNVFDQADGTEVASSTTQAVNFAAALEEAKAYLQSGTLGPFGADQDNIVIISASDGTDSFGTYSDAAEQQFYSGLLSVLEDDAGIDADIDVVAVNSGLGLAEIDSSFWDNIVYDDDYNGYEDADGDGSFNAGVDTNLVIASDNLFDPMLLVELDSDGVIETATDSTSFGLDTLLEAPTDLSAVEVLSVSVGGIEFTVSDADAATAGFQFELIDLIDDPNTAGVVVNYEGDGDPTTIETADVTSLLSPSATDPDTFEFELSLV